MRPIILLALLGASGCATQMAGSSDTLIRSACTHTINQYAHARDAVDTELYSTLFSENAQFTIRGNTTSGKTALIEDLEARGNGPQTKHLMGSISVTPTGPDTAVGTSYAVVINAGGDASQQTPPWTTDTILAFVTYSDTFQISASGCKITARTARIDIERPRQ